MPTSDNPTTGLYLRGLLAAGARPFAPPSSVFRLLGRPVPQGGAMRFPPPLPPVGFVYETLARFGGQLALDSAPLSAPDGRGEARGGPSQFGDDRPAPRASAVATASRSPEPTVSPPHAAPPPVSVALAPAPTRAASEGERVEAASVAPRVEVRDELRSSLVGPPARPPHDSLDGAPSANAAPVAPAPESPSGQDTEQGSVARAAERRVGLAIPGLTQRRAAFAALAGTLPRSEETGAPGVSERPTLPDAEAAPVRPGLAPVERTAATPTSPAVGGRSSRAPRSPEGAAGFQTKVRNGEAIEQVRRAVAAQHAERVTPETVREVAREAAQEAMREGAPRRRPEESPRVQEAPAPVVVVQRTEGEQRVPRSFWSSSALRSTHLRMLR